MSKLIRAIEITSGNMTTDATEATAAWNSGTTYAAAATVSYNNHLYESLQASNTNKNPETQTSWWVDIGPTNPWAMFDNKTGTQTTKTGSLEVSVDVTGRVDSVALFNLDAAAVNITVMDGASEVYNEDISLTSTDGIIDWYTYFFEPIERRSDVARTDLPNVLDPAVTITLTDSDSVAVGHAVIGLAADIGGAQYGASVGITDYSRKVQDDFGEWYIVERGFSKKFRAQMWMEAGRVDFVHRTLSQYRATPVAIIGADDYTSTHVFGLLKDWNIEISYPSHSVMSLEVEGL